MYTNYSEFWSELYFGRPNSDITSALHLIIEFSESQKPSKVKMGFLECTGVMLINPCPIPIILVGNTTG